MKSLLLGSSFGRDVQLASRSRDAAAIGLISVCPACRCGRARLAVGLIAGYGAGWQRGRSLERVTGKATKRRGQAAVTMGGTRQRLSHEQISETFEQVAGRWRRRMLRRHSRGPRLTRTSAQRTSTRNCCGAPRLGGPKGRAHCTHVIEYDLPDRERNAQDDLIILATVTSWQAAPAKTLRIASVVSGVSDARSSRPPGKAIGPASAGRIPAPIANEDHKLVEIIQRFPRRTEASDLSAASPLPDGRRSYSRRQSCESSGNEAWGRSRGFPHPDILLPSGSRSRR